MPMVTVEAIVNCRGSNGKVAVGIATASPATAVNTALVMNRRATRWMLRRICLPSATIPGTTTKSSCTSTTSETERAVWVPRALRDSEAGLLERGHVVDSVAEHRDVATGVGECVHDCAFPSGGSGRRRVRQDGVAQGSGLRGKRFTV